MYCSYCRTKLLETETKSNADLSRKPIQILMVANVLVSAPPDNGNKGVSFFEEQKKEDNDGRFVVSKK
jgi:hypothetical protein